ncbi:MAG: hypothetical protein HY459_00925 [Parcubacteria group bacterium]|nr:hypothetical protein [Parcubacteria group bacterium]
MKWQGILTAAQEKLPEKFGELEQKEAQATYKEQKANEKEAEAKQLGLEAEALRGEAANLRGEAAQVRELIEKLFGISLSPSEIEIVKPKKKVKAQSTLKQERAKPVARPRDKISQTGIAFLQLRAIEFLETNGIPATLEAITANLIQRGLLEPPKTKTYYFQWQVPHLLMRCGCVKRGEVRVEDKNAEVLKLTKMGKDFLAKSAKGSASTPSES